jgi:Glycosyl transferase family 2
VAEWSYAVVVPTVGRPTLQACVDALAAAGDPAPRQLVLADDRRQPSGPLPVVLPVSLADRASVVSVEGRGAAAARNVGWLQVEASVSWIVFLDDDVAVGRCWAQQLAADLRTAGADVAGVQGVICVPRPKGRRPTESERETIALETSQWVTADIAYRRRALEEVGGFDERLSRFREDSDLALRLLDAGWGLGQGARRTTHPIRPAGRWTWLSRQARHGADAAMTSLHGRRWRARAGEGLGPRPGYAAATILAGASAALAGSRRRRAAALAFTGWAAVTTGVAAARIWPGPMTLGDVSVMMATSVAIPPLAVGHWLIGRWQWRNAGSWSGTDQPGGVISTNPWP